jgi:hypothetical protein
VLTYPTAKEGANFLMSTISANMLK